MKIEKIVIGSDHAGYELKEIIKKYLNDKKITVLDKGAHSQESSDYPDFAHLVSEALLNKEAERGILICGSANGVAMAANKHPDIRAAVCWSDEISRLARQHNDANIICIPSRYVSADTGKSMTDIFMDTEFEKGRHQRRVDKIEC